MALLPTYIPQRSLDGIAAELATDGIRLGPVKPGTRVTRTVEHNGTTWEITYLGPCAGAAVWSLRGPGYEHGLWVDETEARQIIAA